MPAQRDDIDEEIYTTNYSAYFDTNAYAMLRSKLLLRKAQNDRESLTRAQAKELAEIARKRLLAGNSGRAYHYSNQVFQALHDFKVLREIVETAKRKGDLRNYDVKKALLNSEDYRTLRQHFNEDDAARYSSPHMKDVESSFFRYVKSFLQRHKTPVATGLHNEIDLMTIHALSKQYDVAVPIARGGLYQGTGRIVRNAYLRAGRERTRAGKTVFKMEGLNKERRRRRQARAVIRQGRDQRRERPRSTLENIQVQAEKRGNIFRPQPVRIWDRNAPQFASVRNYGFPS